MNLTQDQMQQALAALRTQGGTAMNVGGVNYMPLLNDYARTEGYAPGSDLSQYIDGWRTYDYLPTTHKSNYNGKGWTEYDTNGNQTGQGVWTGLKDSNTGQQLAMFAALAGGAGALSAGLGGAAAGAGAGSGAAGAGAGWAEALAAEQAIAGGVGSELAAAGAGAGGLGAAAAGGVPPNPFLPGATGAGAAGAGGLSRLLPSGVSSLLGPAATLAGGLLGSRPQEQSQTQTRDIPEWLKPSVTGLLNAGNQQFQRSTSPERVAELSALRGRAAGLLGSPIAPNQFTTR